MKTEWYPPDARCPSCRHQFVALVNEKNPVEDRLDLANVVAISGVVIGTVVAGPAVGVALGIASTTLMVLGEGIYEDWNGTALVCPDCHHEFATKGLNQWMNDWDEAE